MALEWEGNVNVGETGFYGMSAEGVDAYVVDIKTVVIDKACADLKNNLETLRTAVRSGWTGQAEVNFEKNLEKQINATVEALEAAQAKLVSELYAVANSWIDQDKNMVEVQ